MIKSLTWLEARNRLLWHEITTSGTAPAVSSSSGSGGGGVGY
jgi:hypothetical protein